MQTKVNGLQLSDVPPELSGLNPLELRLICLYLPFMKMVALPSGRQRSIHGLLLMFHQKLTPFVMSYHGC